MLAVSVAIMVDSGGPVLFRQQRVGRNNRLFNLLKFRSFAHANADPTGMRSASRTDERITSVRNSSAGPARCSCLSSSM